MNHNSETTSTVPHRRSLTQASRRVIATFVILGVIGSIFIALYPFPRGPNEYLLKHVTNALHFPGFFGLTIVALFFERFIAQKQARIFTWSLSLILFAALVELIQPHTGRDGSLEDFAHGAFGVVFAAVGCSALFQNRFVLTTSVCLLSILVTALIASPLIEAYSIYQYEQAKFPSLFQRCEARDHVAWEVFPRSKKDKIHTPDPVYGCDLVPVPKPGKFWGVRYMAGGRDWSPFKQLVITIESTAAQTLQLRIDDLEDCTNYADRYNTALEVQPGTNVISIALSDIEQGPKSRKLNLSEIGFVYIFSKNETSNTPVEEDKAENTHGGENTLASSPNSLWKLQGAKLQ